MTPAGNLPTAEACAYLGCSKRTFWALMSEYRVRPVRIGRSRQWKRADLDRVIDARQKARM